MTLSLLLATASCGPVESTAVDSGVRSTPATSYVVRTVHGFQVHVSSAVEASAEGRRALALLEEKLGEVIAALPSSALTRVQRVPLWVSVNDSVCPSACYHPSSAWLTEHGFEPAKSGGVEIANVTAFVKWSNDQPSMVLHELAHGFHHQVLGFGDEQVIAAYEALVASKRFEAVMHVSGGTRRHYALTSAVEMFAELTESAFGRNDFSPFDRAQLAAQEPQLEALMAEKWGRR